MTKFTKLSWIGFSPIIVILMVTIIIVTMVRSKNSSKAVPFESTVKIDTVYVDKPVQVKSKPDTVYLTKPCKKAHCDSESVKPPKIDTIQ